MLMTSHLLTVPRRASTRALVVGVVALFIAVLLPATSAEAAQAGKRECERRTNDTYRELLECVTVGGVRRHQAALQRIADANEGTRASGTSGYDRSADYVAKKLEKAGYNVTRQEFEFGFFELVSSALSINGEVVPPVDPTSGEGEFSVLSYSGVGDISGAALIPTNDVVVPIGDNPPSTSNSGCEPEDFPAPPADTPAIALIQRGTCDFIVKALNAQAAGYEAAIIFNEGQPGRDGVVLGTMGSDAIGAVNIPVVGISYARGAALVDDADATASVSVDALSELRTTENVLAESRSGDADNVVMAGAHLDSVVLGPGINDNASGSAALLETALQMAKVKPVNKLRFAWWGAEEAGLLGSTEYVDGLPEEELGRIALYLNYDMVGSPNYVFTVGDADESTFEAPVPVPEGSVAIEDLFESFYTWKGQPYDDAANDGRSDYLPFAMNGIPVGGLFTGAEVVKTEEQQAIWGGTAGEQFDPCYHLVCDTFDNSSNEALDVNSDGVALAMLTYAYSTETVNQVPGEPVPGEPVNLPDPAGPEGTFGSPDSGGAADHHLAE
jgi:Zn-dependent M28 family amino/carboxypeptidase